MRCRNVCFWISVLIVNCSPVLGQYHFNIETIRSMGNHRNRSNPCKVLEHRIQFDSMGVEYVPWNIEYIYTDDRILSYKYVSDWLLYSSSYDWHMENAEWYLTKIDSTFYFDTARVWRYGGNPSKNLNSKDTLNYVFNKEGNVVLIKDPYGWEVRFTYNTHGDLVNWNSSDKYQYQWTNTYDELGRLLTSSVLTNDKLTHMYTYSYQGNKKTENITTMQETDDFQTGIDTFQRTTISFYRANGTAKRTITRSKEENTLLKFNKKGDVILEKRDALIVGSLHKSITKYSNDYDSLQNIVRQTMRLKQNDERSFTIFHEEVFEFHYDGNCNSQFD